MSSKLSDYDYPLPEALIAKRPLPRRDASRMMVLHRDSQTIEHRQFRDLKTFLRPGDLLVLNNTRVLAARRFSDDYGIEFLFLQKLGPARWKCLVKPGRKMRLSATAKIDNVPMHVEEIDNAQRMLAVGTTTVRVLETVACETRQLKAVKFSNAPIRAQSGPTDLFIYPPYRFQQVDLLFTNFHLPRSTLLMLVSAFAGREFLLRAYQEAIRERYRFYSYGDCMLIL